MNIFSIVGEIVVKYSDAVNNIEKVSKAAKDTAESLEDVDKKADDAGDSVEDAGKSAKNADSGFSTWKATLANLASTAITNLISKCTELAGKMAEVTKSAVGHYAEYEQLVGGVETLFKDSSGKLIGYAEKAYKTAGMSSNQYMETATSFAASLIQGLGSDTEKAVELTNLAITDMSDNANKMGTDMESIQNAYQGFAKQNYTMLDNLKLGYGGTQSEMVRLINDSGILNEKIENLDGITFDQMIEAIHKIQDNLGITGTTALEAGTTISGSWGSVQALFENILTKVGSKLAPTVMGFLQQLSEWMETIDWDAFASSVGDALQKIFDWIQQIDFTTFFEKGMDGVEKFLTSLGGLIEKIPKIIQTFKDWSPLIAGVTAAFVTLKAAMAISSLISAITKSWQAYKKANEGATIAQWLLNAAQLASPAVIIIALIAGLVAAVIVLWNTNDGFREAVISAWETIKEVVSNALNAISTTISNIWNTIVSFLTQVLEGIKSTFTTVWNAIKTAVTTVVNAIRTVITTVWNAIVSFLTPILNTIKNTISNVWNAIKSKISTVLNAIQTTITTIWNAIKTFVTNTINTIKSTISSVFNTIKSTITTVLNGIKSTFSNIWNAVKTTVSNAVNGVKSTISSGLNAAKSTVSNVLGGIKNKFSSIFESAKSIVSGAINKIKGFFNFSWSLPKLKMPHISITGGFSISPPSVPHFGISWYKKAMEDGMIMNQPTIFGYNAKSNQFLAGGEAGSETVVGTDSLMTMIRAAVGEENTALLEKIERIITILEEYFPQMIKAMVQTIVLDSGVLVGELAPKMDTELGKIIDHKGRGN